MFMEFANVSEEGVKNSHGQLNEHNYAAKNARRKLETRSTDMFSRTSTSFNRKLDFLLRLARSEALSVRSMPASDTVLSVRVHQPLVNDRQTRAPCLSSYVVFVFPKFVRPNEIITTNNDNEYNNEIGIFLSYLEFNEIVETQYELPVCCMGWSIMAKLRSHITPFTMCFGNTVNVTFEPDS